MKGILKLAYKLLVNDKAKFTALLVGISFAVFLMIQMTSMFAGVLKRASATVFNLGASVWIMDPAVQTVANTIGMPDYVLDATRSIKGVKYAVPVYSGGAIVKLADGTYQAVNVVGLDDTSLVGRPKLIEGKIGDIYGENGFSVGLGDSTTNLQVRCYVDEILVPRLPLFSKLNWRRRVLGSRRQLRQSRMERRARRRRFPANGGTATTHGDQG